MTIAIAAGKGGTGKTTVAVNLARVVDGPVHLLDCDVEEPDCHLFLRGTPAGSREVGTPVPVVDPEACDGCGECQRICEFGAIVAVKSATLTFPELCHGCGGCVKVCPRKAIHEVAHRIGVLETFHEGPLTLIHGRLDIGVAMAPPLIRAVRREAQRRGTVIIDGPPGTSCSLVAAVRDCDLVILVSEPTPFGLNDLSLAVEALRQIEVPMAVVINRADIGDLRVRSFCREEGVPVLLELPEDRRIARACSEGKVVVDCLPEYRATFRRLWEAALSLARGNTAAEYKTPLECELEAWEQRLERHEGGVGRAGGAG